MGWNDRMPDDPYGPTEDERQSYFDWQEYQEYLMRLDAALDAEEALSEQEQEQAPDAAIQSRGPSPRQGAARQHFLGHSDISEREEAPGCPRSIFRDAEKRGDNAASPGRQVPDHTDAAGP